MAHIEPFRALRYDPARVALSQVITQPYDKITPAMQDRYYSASPYNLVRIILGKRHANDSPNDNPYTRAHQLFGAWRAEGILTPDAQPSIYVYRQQFRSPDDGGLPLERRGFIALGRLEDYSRHIVFRHEQTLAKPKADRLELLRATRAHFGQMFMLYDDPAAEIENALPPAGAPTLELQDEYGVLNRIWKVSDPELIRLVQARMRDKNLIIADGHHRYETALAYRDEWRRTQGKPAETEPCLLPYEFAMMTFVNMASPGLLILATHRVLFDLKNFSSEGLRSGAEEFFAVTEIDRDVSASQATRLLRESGQKGGAFLAVMSDRALLLNRPKASAPLRNVSRLQQGLDVVLLHRRLLEGVLGISDEAIKEQRNLIYLRSAEEAMGRVRSGQAQVAFLVNPVRIEQVRDLAFNGEVMPQKSTDFYPKMLSGLTIYAVE